MSKANNYIFFGSSRLSIIVLQTLKSRGLLPKVIVCPPKEKVGRGLVLKEPQIKELADSLGIKTLQPETLDLNFLKEIKSFKPDFILVASFGKILPKEFLDIGKGALNIHPSLLPKYRGPSPIQNQILNNEKEIGVSIMKMDNLVDHGPLISSKKIDLNDWPMDYLRLEDILARLGADLFADVIDDFLSDKIVPKEQDHDLATFTSLFKKTDGLIDLKDSPENNYFKYLALKSSVGIYFFVLHGDTKVRVKVSEAVFEDGIFVIKKVIPEGRKEIFYEDFKNGLK